MPVEYGHGRKEYIGTTDSSTVTQYTKWFVLNNYEYVIQFSQGMFCIHAHNSVTKITTKCDPSKTLDGAYHNAYTKLRNLGYAAE
ncbi:MAG: hypothetical protein EBV64_11360 [Oxalobacteraceae bacterium]|jgi:hypothetical protein|nr:hypothetical protein [Oxalobacteraceae bacterium]